MAFFPDRVDDWKKTAALIRQAGRIFISSHINPDGDSVGSEMAFAGFLRNMNKPFRIVNSSPTPEAYGFLDPDSVIETAQKPLKDGPRNGDLVVFLDLCNYSRVGEVLGFLDSNRVRRVVIDHHVPERVEADVVVIETAASSTGSLLYDMFLVIDPSLIDRDIAKALLTTIITDTGYFSYSNATSGTLLMAASLYDYGITARDIRKQIEVGEPLYRQRLLGLTLSKVQLTPCGRIAYSYITLTMFAEAGAQREHTEDIINHIRIIRGIKVAILVVQEGEKNFKVSFRATGDVPVNVIAAALGGGGHGKAAGANLYGVLEDVMVLVLDTATSIIDREER